MDFTRKIFGKINFNYMSNLQLITTKDSVLYSIYMNVHIISNAESPYLEKKQKLHDFNSSIPEICASFNISVTKRGKKVSY